MSINVVHPGGEGRDRASSSATSGSPPGSARRCRRLVRHGIGVHHAGMLPKYRRLVETARAGRAAQGHLRHRHARRRHQRADPHRACSPRSRSTTASDTACCRPASSTRSPAGRGGPASTPRARSSCRRPSTTIENERAVAKAGDDPKKLRKIVQRRSRRDGIRLVGSSRRSNGWSRRGARAAHVELRRQPLDAAQRHRATRRRVRRDAPAAHRQPRAACRATAAHPAGHRDLPQPARRRRHRAPRRARRARPRRAAHRRPAGQLRAQPAAVPVRAGRDRAARPRVADLRARRALGDRVHARRSGPGARSRSGSRPRRGRGSR